MWSLLLYDYSFDVRSHFEKLVVENLHNIVEVHRIMPLFYRRHDTLTINSNDWWKIDNYLTNGYEVRETFDLVDVMSSKYINYKEVENITEQREVHGMC